MRTYQEAGDYVAQDQGLLEGFGYDCKNTGGDKDHRQVTYKIEFFGQGEADLQFHHRRIDVWLEVVPRHESFHYTLRVAGDNIWLVVPGHTIL